MGISGTTKDLRKALDGYIVDIPVLDQEKSGMKREKLRTKASASTM